MYTWTIKRGWFLDIIPVCLFGAVETLFFLVLTNELVKYYTEIKSSLALKEIPHQHISISHVGPFNITNVTKMEISTEDQCNIKSLLFYILNTSFIAD